MDLEKIVDIVQKNHNAPGFRYLHFNANDIIYDVLNGFENIKENKKISHSTTFHAFSTTKTITSTAIMQLIQQGKLSLGDKISKHLPQFQFSKSITVKQLLSHQSGLYNPIPLKWVHILSEHSSFDFSSFASDIILKNLRLKFEPGSRFKYSNLNYLILGLLIEKTSGMTYSNYVNEKIGAKLEEQGYFGFQHPEFNHAFAYHKNTFLQRILLRLLLSKKLPYKVNNRWLGIRPFYVNGSSYGGLFCNPNSMAGFCQLLLKQDSGFLKSELISLMFEEAKTTAGSPTGMANSWFTGSLNGISYRCHAGGGAGYYVEIRLYPSIKSGSVIMLNSSGMKDYRLLNKIDKNLITNES